ncbi:MAG: 5-formyltetrahydrofolate cyclo-ligase [Candidatus Diapherotrites archaeon]
MKKKLRKEFKAKRDLLSKEELIEKSNEIKKNLFELQEFRKAKTLFSYISFKSEVRTHELIKEALKKKKRVVIPITDFKKNKIFLSEIKNFEKELEPTLIGLFQPKKEFLRPVNAKELDLIIIPGIAFDEKGNRIGSGKGFFDKFLSELPKKIPVIALAFESQLTKEIPCECHDMKVEKIITEERVVECR